MRDKTFFHTENNIPKNYDLGTVLYGLWCDDCRDSVVWELVPDADIPRYIGRCMCKSRMWYARVDSINVDFEDDV